MTEPTLSHFRLERELGRGGMGIVYEATDLRLGRRVALKVIHPDQAEEQGISAALDQLEREAKLAAAVSHPNLVTIYTFERMEGAALIAMELAEGVSLSDRLAAGWRPTVPEVAWLLEQIALGVAAAHARDIVHLDLKPGNVMLLPDGRVKVLDFGIARSVRELGARGAVHGTPAYMAPEQLRGERPSPATDVWAIGAIGWHLVTGARPYDGPNPGSIAAAVLAGPPAGLFAPSAVQALGGLANPLRRCLCELSRRYIDGGQLARDLAAAARSELGPGFRTQPAVQAPRRDRSTSITVPPTRPERRPVLLGIGAGVALVLLMGAGAAYLASARPAVRAARLPDVGQGPTATADAIPQPEPASPPPVAVMAADSTPATAALDQSTPTVQAWTTPTDAATRQQTTAEPASVDSARLPPTAAKSPGVPTSARGAAPGPVTPAAPASAAEILAARTALLERVQAAVNEQDWARALRLLGPPLTPDAVRAERSRVAAVCRSQSEILGLDLRCPVVP